MPLQSQVTADRILRCMASPRCPAGLSSRAQRAWHTAIRAVDDPDRYWCAVIDYARAIDRSDAIQSAWQRAGRPVTAPGGPHGHVEMPHPLLAALERAEDHTHSLAASLGLTPDGYRKVKPNMGRPKQIVPALPSARRLKPVK